MVCKHEWEVVVDKVIQSPLLDILLGDRKIKSISGASPHRKSISILTCKKCGKINKTIVTI